jgi:hypothetical protein
MKIRSVMTPQRKILTRLAITIAVGALTACSNGSTAATDAAAAATIQSQPPQVAASTPSSSAAEFPSGTELGDLGLPVFPTPPEHVSPHDAGTNGDGEKYDSVLLEPHEAFDTVAAWYTAHMPTGSLVSSPNPKHAEFHIGDDDKVTRMVIIDNIHEGQTHLILMMKTKP